MSIKFNDSIFTTTDKKTEIPEMLIRGKNLIEAKSEHVTPINDNQICELEILDIDRIQAIREAGF